MYIDEKWRKNVKAQRKEEQYLHTHKVYVNFTCSEWENLKYLSEKWNMKTSAAVRKCLRIAFFEELKD